MCVEATFDLLNALELSTLDKRYNMVVDSGLFHVFSDEERSIYAEDLHAVLRPEGQYHMLCFSEHKPGSERPRRIKKDGIRTTFNDGWNVDAIRDTTPELNTDSRDVRAYLASVTRS